MPETAVKSGANSAIADLADKWLRLDKNPSTSTEIKQLVAAKNWTELERRLTWNLSFGTAGVRTRMGAGYSQLNDLTILLLSHGFAQHLLDEQQRRNGASVADSVGGSEIRVVLGYDGRHNSRRFAELTAAVFVHHRIRVYLFSECVPTPVVSFAVPALKCDAGLMITASHNPKEDNGYKAYWLNGAQILSPHDKQICGIAKEAEPKEEYWEGSTKVAQTGLVEPAERLLGDRYYDTESAICCFYRELNAKSHFRITYSAFHGVGSKFVRRMFDKFGFPASNISYVKEQDEPDPDFPTLIFPNPEEGSRVLQLSFQTADANQATIVLANDPDADRLQLAEKEPTGKWRVFSGNEMGALLSWWIWTQWRERNPGKDAADVFILNSAVSSQIVATMAKREGFRNALSLTGFKWIGNLADKLQAEGKTVILAWEESIGFAAGTTRDKDGVSAAAIFAEMANWLQTQHSPPFTLHQQLFAIYEKYGFHLCRNSYWIVPSPDVTKTMFANMRANGEYPRELGGSGPIQFVRDLTTGFDNSQPDQKAILPLSTTSEMITFTLENGSVVTLRASGTEPKIKYYIELVTEPGKTANDLVHVEEALNRLESDVVDILLQPKRYGLVSRQ